MTSARGIRNNNPMNLLGNLQDGHIQWWGMSANQTDPPYYQFDDVKFGIRAGVKVLLNYQKLHKIQTISEALKRYAPSSENDTAAYIADVCKRTGLGPDQQINFSEHMPELVRAIIWHENGEQPYSDDIIQNGIDLAEEEPNG